MGQLTLQSSLVIDNSIVISVDKFKSTYLTGITIPSSVSDELLKNQLEASISEIESFLSVKLKKQIIEETKDFYQDDWRSWGFIKTTYPVVCPIKIDGFLGTTKQISYPATWLSVRRTNDIKTYSRQIHLVPNRNSSHSEAIIYSGLFPQTVTFASKQIPNYWTLQYVTGWSSIPKDIVNAVCFLTLVNVLPILSDAIMTSSSGKQVDINGQPRNIQTGITGFGLGVGSRSISIDGLSQSFSTYVNGNTGLFGARLKQLLDQLNPNTPGSMLRRLYDTYGAIKMGVA